MAGVLFEDIFDVKDINAEGKKFDRGSYNIYIYQMNHRIRNGQIIPWTKF